MKKMKILCVLLLTLIGTSVTHGSEISIETDPVAWALDGDALHIKRSSTFHSNLTTGFGYFKLELPEFMIDQNKKNRNRGWDVTVDNGYEIYLDYFLSNPDKGWFTGLQMSLYEFEIQRNNGSSNFSNAISLWRSGYLWKPTGAGFYLMPWAAIGYSQKVSGKNSVNGETYDVEPLIFFATLYVGYSF